MKIERIDENKIEISVDKAIDSDADEVKAIELKFSVVIDLVELFDELGKAGLSEKVKSLLGYKKDK